MKRASGPGRKLSHGSCVRLKQGAHLAVCWREIRELPGMSPVLVWTTALKIHPRCARSGEPRCFAAVPPWARGLRAGRVQNRARAGIRVRRTGEGDGQHDPAYIPKLLDTLRSTTCDMVIGSRYLNGGFSVYEYRPGGRHLGVPAVFLRPILGKPVHDPTSGFVAVKRTALDVFSRSFPLEYPEIEALVVLQRRRFQFQEVPCRMRPRRGGRTSITATKSLYSNIIHVLLGVFVNVLRFEGRRRRR